MPDPTCIGSPFVDNCPERPTHLIYNLSGMPTYFCNEHYESAVAWLTGRDHGCEEAEKLAGDVLSLNAQMGNPIRGN